MAIIQQTGDGTGPGEGDSDPAQTLTLPDQINVTSRSRVARLVGWLRQIKFERTVAIS